MTDATYKTTATGSIDYAHYIRKSHEIRSAEALAALGWIASALMSLTKSFTGKPMHKVTSNEPQCEKMRQPLDRSTRRADNVWRRNNQPSHRSEAA